MAREILNINNLTIGFGTDLPVVDDVSLDIGKGRVTAIVGESGSGKTMLARSLLNLLPGRAQIRSGEIRFDGKILSELTAKEMQSVRGAQIGMIFQEPMVSLNPSLKIGYQMTEGVRKHFGISSSAAQRLAVDQLDRVKILSPKSCLDEYPHEFSGGMRQRIMIASALMLSPKLLIADEPTTALDCLVQKEILEILGEITKSDETSVLLISHDLALVAHYADDVLVMNKGKAMEQGDVLDVIGNPSHDYTKTLLSSLPQAGSERENTHEGKPLVSVKNLCVQYPIRKNWMFEAQTFKPVLHDVSFDVRLGETLAVVGESGSGKTTLGRTILQLVTANSGSIEIGGHKIDRNSKPDFKMMSSVAQLIFQDPYSSLSPRHTIGRIIGEPLRAQGYEDSVKTAVSLLEEVGLDTQYLSRYPNELSGGQRQRVSIARALICDPKLVIADEPVSALDITIQAQILKLLDRLRKERGFSCLFISHDLGVVEQIADRVAVLYKGQLVELATASELFSQPCHPYTQDLLCALPELRGNGRGGYRLVQRSPAPFEFPAGMLAGGETPGQDLIYHNVSDNHVVACMQ